MAQITTKRALPLAKRVLPLASLLLGLAGFIPPTYPQQTDMYASTQAKGGGMPEMAMGQMGHGSRPDMAPPVDVMGGHNPMQGTWMLSYQGMRMDMGGNRRGTSRVSISDVLNDFMVAPREMTMDMHMVGVMYGITDDFGVMAMVPYLRKKMSHVNRVGVDFTTKSEGVGDVQVSGSFRLRAGGGHGVRLSAGLSLPSGSIDEKDDTPSGANQQLPYPMQLGSGTYDFLPGVTYTGRSDDYSWGGQLGATVRFGKNDNGYRWGNIYRLTLWAARRWTNWLSSSLRVGGETEANIRGADPSLNPAMVPTADPNLRGGERIELGLGINLLAPSGALKGHRLAIEFGLPVYQNLDGPQLERDWTATIGWRKAF
ncbi:MAG: transporter [Alphaproteobacteria bacterium]